MKSEEPDLVCPVLPRRHYLRERERGDRWERLATHTSQAAEQATGAAERLAGRMTDEVP